MIELKKDSLVFTFPEVHTSARLCIDFQRTLRIPDDSKTYSLPPGLGSFPLRHVDDFAERVPDSWVKHGGIVLPMYQSEALWIYFRPSVDYVRGVRYPFAIKVATGKVNAVSGELWAKGLSRDPQQGYLVAPKQPWLDGYCVEKGVIRQFVAMPLGAGYSAEEQITGEAEYGGLQVEVIPMKADVYKKRFVDRDRRGGIGGYHGMRAVPAVCYEAAMGLAPGGRMKQNIEEDPYDLSDWDVDRASRCFVHIANSLVWRQITGENPPTTPPTAKEYTAAGLPWFDRYDEDSKPAEGSDRLAGLKSVVQLGLELKQAPLPENESVTPLHVVKLRATLKPDQVREFEEV